MDLMELACFGDGETIVLHVDSYQQFRGERPPVCSTKEEATSASLLLLVAMPLFLVLVASCS